MTGLRAEAAGTEIWDWLVDRKNRRIIPHRIEQCGYIPVRNDAAKDGLFKLNGQRQAIYARDSLSIADRSRGARVGEVGEDSKSPISIPSHAKATTGVSGRPHA
jgi:hypothetical protein